jgi:hypothetical protein
MANDFVDQFELTHTMLWDESFQSWAALGVSLQPSAMLFAADGTLLGEWLGAFNEEEVLELVGGSAGLTQSAGAPESFCRFAERFERAQRDAGAYASADEGRRQRILDDLRYAANAMAQTAGPDIAAPVEQLAEAVRVHSQVLLDAGLAADPATVAGREAATAEYAAALQAMQAPSLERCGITLQAGTAP